jgi:hypothetical protein
MGKKSKKQFKPKILIFWSPIVLQNTVFPLLRRFEIKNSDNHSKTPFLSFSFSIIMDSNNYKAPEDLNVSDYFKQTTAKAGPSAVTITTQIIMEILESERWIF